MKSPAKESGAAAVLVVVGIVIVGWTIGLLMQDRPQKKSPDSKSKKEAAAQVEAQKQTGQSRAK